MQFDFSKDRCDDNMPVFTYNACAAYNLTHLEQKQHNVSVTLADWYMKMNASSVKSVMKLIYV